ncbi:hypothetical protein CWI75_04750 [Kineobactrum sediminis]|uniref:DUF4412 domain-containing protein n=1 Tax=Kineobactrum sediminis TaxID=1905677 RepID=A0A2N5Y5I8_9GAMM|nr:hypothetical protein [Kineobactrum sediminis]PLW83663.1 hypothetical protein CWI75_04750 [Kineobactrum sediminis]
MLKTFISLLGMMSVIATANADSDCVDPSTVVGGVFEITSGSDQAVKSLTLLRQTPARVVYLMTTENMTRIYENYGGGRVAVTEYFDLESKGVEHEPSVDIAPNGWDTLYQLLPSAEAGRLQHVGEEQYRCLTVARYESHTSEPRLALSYLDEVQLPLALTSETAGTTLTWKLTELVTDTRILDETLTRVASYKTFDFADLGDHEDEVFFRNGEYLQYQRNVHAHGGHEH